MDGLWNIMAKLLSAWEDQETQRKQYPILVPKMSKGLRGTQKEGTVKKKLFLCTSFTPKV